MPKLGTTTWDAALARRLYDEGANYKHIGKQVSAAASLVSQFASRHWPARDQAMAYQPGGRKRGSDEPRPLPRSRTTLPPLPSLAAYPSWRRCRLNTALASPIRTSRAEPPAPTKA
jgi:hypothetical protein